MTLQFAINDRSTKPKPTRLARRPSPIWPKSLKEAEQLAELVFDAKLAPRGFGSSKACLVGILFGMELGLSPMAALQKIAIIDGRPTIWGDAALGLVQSSGLMTSFSETLEQETDPATNHMRWIASCTVTRVGQREPIIRTFTSDDAKRAGLWQKPGPWTQYPKRMLTIRARAFALRDAFPDALLGLAIREELDSGTTMEEEASPSPLAQEFDAHLPKNQSPEPEPEPTVTPPVRRAPPPPPSPQTAPEPDDTPRKEPLYGNEPREGQAFAPTQPADAAQLIEDFGNALCCAFDHETLEEIREEFQPKIDALGREHIAHAGRLFLTHEQRIERQDFALPKTMETKNYSTGDLTPPAEPSHACQPSERALKMARRPSRGAMTSRARPLTLLAFNARQRLATHNPQGLKQEDGEDRNEGQAGAHMNDAPSASETDPDQKASH